ncbi:hypothetical protein [Acinetobacter sp.]|uniref:hypothetical protein n=1 Tax=Acinetobacter sp. TaxID=472 RepID=UPI003D071BE7
MSFFAFFVLGVITGLGSALMLIRFDGGWLKAISITGGSGILIAEFLVFYNLLGISADDKSLALVILLLTWLLSFCVFICIFIKSFKKQELKYKIHTWEILLGDKKTIDGYYSSKREEISKKLEDEFNLNTLKSEKQEIKEERQKIEEEKKILLIDKEQLKLLQDEVEEILDKKHKIDIPNNFKFPIKSDFFEVLPRYISAISEFEHHLSNFTDSFIEDIDLKRNQYNDISIFRTYLNGLGNYIGQYLFNWREVRIHFRLLNDQNNQYEKFLAIHKKGVIYTEDLTNIPVDKGLIALAISSKRSLVFSANKRSAFKSNSTHIWKDYMTIIFEKLQSETGKPYLSLGISVKHEVDHKQMLYFLSYIQIEQVIQENILRLNDKLVISKVVEKEVA